MKQYILSLDQGTTSSRAILFDKQQNIVNIAQKEFTQIYPKEGYVEHDPMEIYSTQYGVMAEVIAKSAIDKNDIAAIGITNQRETTIIWDKRTGKPVYNAIVWQCRRTADICEQLKQQKELTTYIKQNTGLIIDAYFSASKIKWILDHVPHAKEDARNGHLLFGTVDTWLVWKLTNGAVHVTDYTNASRTMLFNIKTLQWDKKLLDLFEIPLCMMPEVKSSSEIYGYANVMGNMIPISGIAGDQQASLFGQACFTAGDAKNTYGTGCFLLMNTGKQIISSNNGLLSTIGIGLKNNICYAIEGSVFCGGSVVQWLRDELQLIQNSAESEYFAAQVPNTGGVYVVPAFTGLGAPHWDMYARGSILGLTRGSNKNHIIRAALEAIAYQSKDVFDAIIEDSGIDITALKVDGGACANNLLMQFQADILQKRVIRPKILETTALGACYLAGLAVGFFKDLDDIKKEKEIDRVYTPQMNNETRQVLCQGWRRALTRAKGWIQK